MRGSLKNQDIDRKPFYKTRVSVVSVEVNSPTDLNETVRTPGFEVRVPEHRTWPSCLLNYSNFINSTSLCFCVHISKGGL